MRPERTQTRSHAAILCSCLRLIVVVSSVGFASRGEQFQLVAGAVDRNPEHAKPVLHPRDRAQRLGLLGVPGTTHHEDWRLHAKVADAFQQVETLLPAAADPWYDHVEQDEIERST